MATITKRGNPYRATISLYQKGEYKRKTKTFKEKKDAELWILEMELEKGRGKNIAERSTLFREKNYLKEMLLCLLLSLKSLDNIA